MSIKLRTPAGGSLELKADDTLATDEVVEISNTEVQVKSPDGSIWAIRVDDSGNITATKVS